MAKNFRDRKFEGAASLSIKTAKNGEIVDITHNCVFLTIKIITATLPKNDSKITKEEINALAIKQKSTKTAAKQMLIALKALSKQITEKESEGWKVAERFEETWASKTKLLSISQRMYKGEKPQYPEGSTVISFGRIFIPKEEAE